MWRSPQSVVLILAIAGVCSAQRESPLATRPVVLRLFVPIYSYSDKAANATIELMDAVGFSSAMDRKLTDNDGTATFQTASGVHRIRITGPNIQPYEGELEITRSETSHVERIRVHRTQGGREASESLPGGVVPAVRLRI